MKLPLFRILSLLTEWAVGPMYVVEPGASAAAEPVGDDPGAAGADSGASSLRDSLEANFEAAEKTSADDDGGSDLSEAGRRLAAARKGAQAAEPGTDDPEAKRAAERAAMSPEDRAKAEETDRNQATAQAVEAPQHWSAQDRELFSKQPPEVKSWLLGRHKAMEADYTRRVQEVAGTKRFQEALNEVFQPFRESMQRDGIDDVTAIRQLVGAHTYLQKDPAAGIRWLADKYGIDLRQVTEGGATEAGSQPDPYVRQLESRVAETDKKLQSFLAAQQQEAHKTNLSKVEQFAEEKDAQGKPMRPYFDDVAQDIALMLRAAREAGQPLDLQSAYDRAIYANPATRAKVLAAQQAEQRAKDEEERKRKVGSARTAGFDVKGQGSAASVASGTQSLREALEKAYDQAEGRV